MTSYSLEQLGSNLIHDSLSFQNSLMNTIVQNEIITQTDFPSISFGIEHQDTWLFQLILKHRSLSKKLKSQVKQLSTLFEQLQIVDGPLTSDMELFTSLKKMAFLQSEELLKLQQNCEILRIKVNPKGHFLDENMNGNCEENKMDSKSIHINDSVCYSRESEENSCETNLDFSNVCQSLHKLDTAYKVNSFGTKASTMVCTNMEKDIKVYCLKGIKKICLDKE